MKKLSAVLTFSLLLINPVPGIHSVVGQSTSAPPAAAVAAAASGASGSYALIFPQTANGVEAGTAIRSSVILINNSGAQTHGNLRFYSNDGRPMTLSTDRGVGDSFGFTLGPGRVFRIETDGQGPMRTGWARVDSDVELSGSGTFTVLDGRGEVLSDVGIADSVPALQQMIFAQSTTDTWSAFAVCNPDAGSAARMQLEVRSLDGKPVASKTAVLGPLAHMAQFVGEAFAEASTGNFIGVLAISADLPVSLVTLRQTGTNYTALPSVPASDAGQAARDLIFPRVGDGLSGDSRFRTTFLAMNGSDAAQAATLELFRSDGTALEVMIGSARSSRFDVTIPAHGAVRLETAGQSIPAALGWARIKCGSAVGGGAIFTTTESGSGKFLSEIGVPSSAEADRQAIYVRDKGGNYTGLAVNNASAQELTVRLRLHSGTTAGGGDPGAPAETTFRLPAFGGLGKFIYEFFPPVPEMAGNNFEGSLEIESWSTRFGEDIVQPLAGLTLLSRGHRYTSLPTAPYRVVSKPLSAFDSRVNELLAQMTLDEKVGQMTQAERGSLSAGDIEALFLGSILSGGGSGPPVNSVAAWADMYDGFQSQALKTRLKIPILYGIDAVHGHNNVRGAVVFPHNIGLGATRNPETVRMAARITAAEVRATGMNWTFSPVVAVPQDERWGRTYEGFGEDPGLVREMGRAAVSGYQGATLTDAAGIVACAKHYLGDGGTRWGTGTPIDQGDTRVDEATLRRLHLPGYLGALEAGVGTIMVSFSSWNGQKMTGNRYLLTDVLKGELGFEGFLVSDWAAIDQLPFGSYRDQVKAAVNAGIDMGMVPYRHREFFNTLKNLAQSGEVPISRIDDAVRRILRVKFAAGLFDRSPVTDRTYQARFGSDEHREVAREAVRQSLVLLKNERNLLPLSKSLGRIFVAGAAADDVGKQCGGWTISWQGGTGSITPGTSILRAIRQAVSPATSVTYSADGSGAAGADVGVVVVGESPYAEGPGDNGSLSLSAQDIATIDNVRQTGIPMVVILISGRPLILGTALDKAGAFVAAWLPGTEGAGVADVLFGDYHPTGKLPCSWPRSVSQIPINIGDPGYDPLFPYGYGLTY